MGHTGRPESEGPVEAALPWDSLPVPSGVHHSCRLESAYSEPGTGPGSSVCIVLFTSLCTDGESGAQRGRVTCLSERT